MGEWEVKRPRLPDSDCRDASSPHSPPLSEPTTGPGAVCVVDIMVLSLSSLKVRGRFQHSMSVFCSEDAGDCPL